MLKINRKLSQKGFSLIELMVAIAILGIVSLGIFQSYQVGFWGMSDARARTIATNIAQEKLEEVKGKTLDADTYPDPDNPIVVSGKEFNATVIVEEETTTLKKIITTVSWQKRNGDQTQISIESLQNMAPASPSDDVATSILVNANPTSINVGDTTQIKVTILDQDNYPISYNGQVDLSLIPSSPVLGTLTDNSLIFNGESYKITSFTATDAGEVEVKAESEGLIPNFDTITITGGEPVKINLVVDPTSILINGQTSTLTVRIEDEEGYLADSWTGTVKLQLAFSSDEYSNEIDTGDLGDPPVGDSDTITIDFNEENIKTTLFTSSDTPGVAQIEAIDTTGGVGYTPLTPDTDETITVTLGPPSQIDIEANPKSIFVSNYTGDGNISSEITVTIKNATDVPTSGFVGTVTLSILSGSESGELVDEILNFNRESVLPTTFNSSETAGIVEIKAEDTTDGGVGYTPLTSDTETITVAAGPPDHLGLVAAPDIIVNNGIDSSTLVITVEDFDGNRTSFNVENKEITFILEYSPEPPPDEGMVHNLPLVLPAGESQIITTYTCNDSNYEGYVTITANCEGISNSESITIQIASRIIRPAEDPNISYGPRFYYRNRPYGEDQSKVDFDIEVLGGTIKITQIDLAWKEGSQVQRRLQKITIFEKDNYSHKKIIEDYGYGETIPIYPSFFQIPASGDDFDYYDVNDFAPGIYTVEIDYRGKVEGSTIIIQFHARYQDTDHIFQLEFLSPDLIV